MFPPVKITAVDGRNASLRGLRWGRRVGVGLMLGLMLASCRTVSGPDGNAPNGNVPNGSAPNGNAPEQPAPPTTPPPTLPTEPAPTVEVPFRVIRKAATAAPAAAAPPPAAAATAVGDGWDQPLSGDWD